MDRDRKILLLTLLLSFCVYVLPIQVPAQEVSCSIQLNVEEIGQKRGSVPIGEPHRWILRCMLPETKEDCVYSIQQTLPPSLSFCPESVVMQYISQGGTAAALEMGTDYTMACGSVFVEEGIADRISLEITGSGMADARSGGELRIFYEAVLNENAPVGRQILSSAQLTCTYESGRREIYLSDRASVYTGGIHILLMDSENRPCAKGRFMLARPAAQMEIGDPRIEKEHLDITGEPIAVVYETFYTSKDLSGERVSVVETNEKGEAMCLGLAFGTYYLVRTDAPAVPVKVKVDEASHLTHSDGWTDIEGRAIDNTIHVENIGLQMPQTGGPGRIGYTASGIAVILCACLLLWFNREKAIYI